MSLPPFIQECAEGWQLSVRVQPGAKKSELCGRVENMLRLRLNAPAVDNKANEALLEYLAGLLNIRKSKIRLLSGEKSRIKRLGIAREAEPDFSLLLAVGEN